VSASDSSPNSKTMSPTAACCFSKRRAQARAHCGRDRAGVTERRDRPFGQPSYTRPDRLRPLSARLCVRLVERTHPAEALRLLEQAIALDPRYGPALGWAARCCVQALLERRSADPEADRLKAADFARRALEMAGDDPGVPGACRSCAGVRRRGHRRDARVGRPCPGAEPELCAGLARQPARTSARCSRWSTVPWC
jgi:hypothetical protein